MQVMFNSQERTLREMVTLTLSAGWKIVKVTKTPGSLFGYLVAEPVPIPDAPTAAPGVTAGVDEPAPHATSMSAALIDEPGLALRALEREQLLRDTSSRCGTPTFGSHMRLSSASETLSRAGQRRAPAAPSQHDAQRLFPVRGAADTAHPEARTLPLRVHGQKEEAIPALGPARQLASPRIADSGPVPAPDAVADDVAQNRGRTVPAAGPRRATHDCAPHVAGGAAQPRPRTGCISHWARRRPLSRPSLVRALPSRPAPARRAP